MFNLDVTHKCLIAECWCAVDDLDRIQQALKRGSVSLIYTRLLQLVYVLLAYINIDTYGLIA